MRTRDGGDIFTSYLDASERLRDMPHSLKARADYADMARQFQDHLSPYVLRRDKREMREIQDFERLSGISAQDYRSFGKVEVNPLELTPGWKQAICAAEALSIAARQAEDTLAKRLRLTMGNGHGIAALLDQAVSDKDTDKEQCEADGDIAAVPTVSDLKRHQRIDWWKQMIGQSFRGGSDPLYQHPAINAAIRAIETITAQGRKVLVFGRFTLPMQALVRMLNARAMLRALDAREAWPQAVIDEEDWPAIEIAHSAIRKTAVDREALKAELARQYDALDYQRRRRRSPARRLANMPDRNPMASSMRCFRRRSEQPQAQRWPDTARPAGPCPGGCRHRGKAIGQGLGRSFHSPDRDGFAPGE
jgi:hypothetical protein